MGKGARPCFGFPCACPIPVPPLWPQLGELVLPGLCGHGALSEQQPLHLRLLFVLQLILKASKNMPFSFISATSLFLLVKYLGEQSMFGFGARGRFESSLWCQALVGSWALGLRCGPHRVAGGGTIFQHPKTIWDLLHSTKGGLDELAQAGLVALALRAKGPRMFAWVPEAVS